MTEERFHEIKHMLNKIKSLEGRTRDLKEAIVYGNQENVHFEITRSLGGDRYYPITINSEHLNPVLEKEFDILTEQLAELKAEFEALDP